MDSDGGSIVLNRAACRKLLKTGTRRTECVPPFVQMLSPSSSSSCVLDPFYMQHPVEFAVFILAEGYIGFFPLHVGMCGGLSECFVGTSR